MTSMTSPTAPVWMALPPEVHSASLSTGPGAGPLLAAAAAWHHLSTEYACAADELEAMLATVATTSWQGPTADRYLNAHLPYLAWLRQAATAAGLRAAAQQAAAGAFGAALAAMPTSPELVANHVAHGALVTTNFFGINTVPIALNEADYARMWVQAATVMTGYQATAGAALSASPPTEPPPLIAKSGAASEPNDPFGLGALLAKLQQFEGANNPLELIWPGNPFTAYPPGTDLGGALSEAWTSFTQGLFMYSPQTLTFTQNPVQWIAAFALAGVQLVTHRIFDLLQLVYNFPQLLAAAVPAVTSAVGGLGGFAGLAGLAGLPTPAGAPVAAVSAPAPPGPPPPLATVAATTPSVPPGPAPAAVTAAAPALPPTAPPPVTGAEVFGYLVGGGPGTSFGSGGRAVAPRPIADTAAAPAATRAADEPARSRRRRRARMREPAHAHRYEFLDGSGAIGFAGTAIRPVQAAGLATLAGDSFDRGPTMPILPDSWSDGGTEARG